MSSLAEQEQRWLSGKHYGTSKPELKAWVRAGHLERHYKPKPDKEVFCFVPGLSGPNYVWYAEWVADEDFVEVPNLLTVSGENDFEANGVEHVTVEMDNVQLAEREGMGSVFHVIERGFMAPTRGDAGFNSAAAGSTNQWRDVWKNQATQIMICGGYGDAFFPLFLGLVDTADLTSSPDKITVTARSMGKVFTDQHTFMDAKNLFVKDPITFCDRQQADELQLIEKQPMAASSNDGSHFANYAMDQSTDSSWISGPNDSSNAVEWLEVTINNVINGRYEDFVLHPHFAGMEVFVSVFVAPTPGPTGALNAPAHPTDEPEHGLPTGWVDFEKLGNVPGSGLPYVAHYESVSGQKAHLKIRKGGGGYVTGPGTKIRLTFRNLKEASVGKKTGFFAGIKEWEVFNRKRLEAAVTNNWLLIDDVSDIIKVVCQWAGFSDLDDWEIERAGSRLKDKLVFDRTTFLIDPIKKIEEATSYTFQVKPPASFDPDNLGPEHNLSMGRITFRENQAMTSVTKEKRYSIRDDQTITGIQPIFDSSGLAQSIRTRGKLILEDRHNTPSSPGVAQAHHQGSGYKGRFFANYRPVWARENENRAAGIRKHEYHLNNQFTSNEDCLVAALLIAYRMALEAAKASVEVPLFPVFLDQQIQIFDLGTGMSTRLWIVSRDWSWQGGEDAEFKMTLGGSLLDVDIVERTREELREVLDGAGENPAPIARGPWEEAHLF